jgi:hypothetical protein
MESQPQGNLNVDLYRLWGQFFSPIGNPERQISISMNWAPFLTSKLLNKNNFEWTKKFLNSSSWPLLQEDKASESLQFSIPMAWPKKMVLCYARDLNFLEIENSQSSQGTPKQEDQTKLQPSSTTLLMPRKADGIGRF